MLLGGGEYEDGKHDGSEAGNDAAAGTDANAGTDGNGDGSKDEHDDESDDASDDASASSEPLCSEVSYHISEQSECAVFLSFTAAATPTLAKIEPLLRRMLRAIAEATEAAAVDADVQTEKGMG